MEAELKKLIVEVIVKKEIIGSTEKEDTAKGVVISKGKNCDCLAKKGDTILFSGFGGLKFTKDGKNYRALNQDEPFVVL